MDHETLRQRRLHIEYAYLEPPMRRGPLDHMRERMQRMSGSIDWCEQSISIRHVEVSLRRTLDTAVCHLGNGSVPGYLPMLSAFVRLVFQSADAHCYHPTV